jgi:hypothetical protein
MARHKKLFLVLVLPASLGFLAILPWAGSSGEYHVGGTLVCYDCHTIHFSQAHQWGSSNPVSTLPAPGGNWLPTSGPNTHLLKAPPNTLCLACHDGQNFAPDVLGPNANSYVRQAGALNDTVGTAPYETWKGHTLDMTATPPGGVSTITLTCLQCHNKHGSASYRNLTGAIPVTYTKGEQYASRTKTVDVWLKQWNQGDLPGNYAYDSVRFNEPNPINGAYADFCQGCHVAFHGPVGGNAIGGNLGTGGFLRHPNAQVNIGAINDGAHSSIAQYNAGTTRVHVMSNSSTDYLANPGNGTFTAGDGLTPTCFSCHKAHGNANPFGLIFLGQNAAVVTEEGGYNAGQTHDVGTGLRNLCVQCHTQAN